VIETGHAPNQSTAQGDAMAVLQGNKFRVYHSLFQINRAFNAVVHHVRELEESGVFPSVKMRVLRGLTRELQSQISHDVTDRMHSVEDDEMFRWEKVRIAREKYLDPDKSR
jgi:hypothetical protein